MHSTHKSFDNKNVVCMYLLNIKEFFLHKYSLEIYSWVKVIYSTFGFLGHMSKFNRIITVDILRLFLSMYFHKILNSSSATFLHYTKLFNVKMCFKIRKICKIIIYVCDISRRENTTKLCKIHLQRKKNPSPLSNF